MRQSAVPALLLSGILSMVWIGWCLPAAAGDSPAASRPAVPSAPDPIPDSGPVPPMVKYSDAVATEAELSHRAKARGYTQQLRAIRRKHFGTMKVEAIRQAGIEKLSEFTDPASFKPMIDVLVREADDVKLGMLDHFTTQGPDGQAALAWVAIYDGDKAIRHEASVRMTQPVPRQVLVVLDQAFRSTKHAVANAAGRLAGFLDIKEAIPLLIFNMATSDEVERQGDLAWIAIETTRAFVSNITPVVGDNAGAFNPVIGTLHEGSLLRIRDAVAITYRVDVYNALVGITSADWGQSTADMGYNMREWWVWYNEVYVPFKEEQARLARLSEGTADDGTATP